MLYRKVISLLDFNKVYTKDIELTKQPEIVKCGLPVIGQVKKNFDKFSKEQKAIITSLLSRPVLTHFLDSPSGIFRIHYNIRGSDAPSYSVADAAGAIDSVYEYIVNYMGFLPPPSDDGEGGGDEKYDIYIRDLGNRIYGITTPERILSYHSSTSYIQIDNDFASFPTKGLPAAKVTLAHEFHHAVQLGNYSLEFDDVFYFDITSTSMEDFIFDYVDDYISWMPRYFNAPYYSFSSTLGDGYDLAIWNIYLKEKFSDVSDTTGFAIIRYSWELMRNQRALTAIANALEFYGSSFKSELNNFGIWTYFTNYRTKPNQYFKDANKYPVIKRFGKYNLIPPEYSIELSVDPLTNNFLTFIDESQGLSDTLISIITNGDVSSGIDYNSFPPNPDPQIDLTYTIESTQFNGSHEIIKDRYYSLISSANADYFSESNIFNNELASEASSNFIEIDFAYPQPFKYKNGNFLRIPTKPNVLNEAELSVYTTSMKSIYTSTKQINTGAGKIVLHWDGLDNSGNKLPTGIYIFVTDSEGSLTKGKIAILNE
jgi:hypothetical protein